MSTSGAAVSKCIPCICRPNCHCGHRENFARHSSIPKNKNVKRNKAIPKRKSHDEEAGLVVIDVSDGWSSCLRKHLKRHNTSIDSKTVFSRVTSARTRLY